MKPAVPGEKPGKPGSPGSSSKPSDPDEAAEPVKELEPDKDPQVQRALELLKGWQVFSTLMASRAEPLPDEEMKSAKKADEEPDSASP